MSVAEAPEPQPATVADALERPPVVVPVDIVHGDTVRRYTFQSIGRGALRRLTEKHPPTEEHHAAAQEEAARFGVANPERVRAKWNPETFPPALLAAASAEPKLTIAVAEEIAENWNDADFEELFTAAVAAQQIRATVPEAT